MKKRLERLNSSLSGKIIVRTYQRWKEVDGDQRAASFAWFLLLSILPLVIMLVILGSFFVEREVATKELIQWLYNYTPLTQDQKARVVEIMNNLMDARSGVNLLAFILLVWSSLKFLRTLVKSSNRIWQSHPYSWWRLPLKSLTLLGITISAVLIGVLLPAVAQLARDWITSYQALPEMAFTAIFSVIPWVVLFYGLIMIYRIAPSRKTRFSEVWAGALVATLMIWVGENLFLFYVSNISSFNVVYGTLGGVVAFLLWLYLSSSICIIGVCLSAARVEVRELSRDHEATPASDPRVGSSR